MSKKRREKTKAKQQRHKQENTTNKIENAAPSQSARSTKQIKTTQTTPPKPSKITSSNISKALLSKPSQLQVNANLKQAAPEWKAFYSQLSHSMNNN